MAQPVLLLQLGPPLPAATCTPCTQTACLPSDIACPSPCPPPQNVKQLRLTRKASLLTAAAAGLLPSAVEAVAEGALLAGYVASVTSGAVFVR